MKSMFRLQNIPKGNPRPWILLFVVLNCVVYLFIRQPLPEHVLDRLGVNGELQRLKSAISHIGKTRLQRHPVEHFMMEAQERFDTMIARQSTTYTAASAEYQRRYGRDPPPGFEQWVEHALAMESPIVDEFDDLDRALRGFYKMSGAHVQQTVEEMSADANWMTVCEIQNGVILEGCGVGNGFETLIGNESVLHIPNVKFLVNFLDEPRVINGELLTSSRYNKRDDAWNDLSHQSTWEKLTSVCPGGGAAKSLSNLLGRPHQPQNTPPQRRSSKAHKLTWVEDNVAALDICQHPEYATLHGFFTSPATFRYTPSAVPILSVAAISTMSDLLCPALAYSSPTYAYSEEEDVDWQEKTDGVHWAGGTTGSFVANTTMGWQDHHRQRLVELAHNLRHDGPYTYLQRSDDDPESWTTTTRDGVDESLYNVHFTNTVQCEIGGCDAERQYFGSGFTGHQNRGETLRYTLAIDVDGNGHSGRFYRLLASKSLPLKQTMFREWHDERLIPWLHYVPVSLSMGELPELVRYLAEDDEGREHARVLAMKGREWYNSSLRPVDRGLYIYRLLLELAHVQDPARLAMA